MYCAAVLEEHGVVGHVDPLVDGGHGANQLLAVVHIREQVVSCPELSLGNDPGRVEHVLARPRGDAHLGPVVTGGVLHIAREPGVDTLRPQDVGGDVTEVGTGKGGNERGVADQRLWVHCLLKHHAGSTLASSSVKQCKVYDVYLHLVVAGDEMVGVVHGGGVDGVPVEDSKSSPVIVIEH